MVSFIFAYLWTNRSQNNYSGRASSPDGGEAAGALAWRFEFGTPAIAAAELQFWTKQLSKSKILLWTKNPKTAIVAEPAALMVVTPPARSPGGLSLARRRAIAAAEPASHRQQ